MKSCNNTLNGGLKYCKHFLSLNGASISSINLNNTLILLNLIIL